MVKWEQRRSSLLVVIVALLLTMFGLTASAPPAVPVVTAQGTTLRLNGVDWWPAGINAPELLTRYALNEGCGAQVDLDAFFAATPPHALIRFNLFQHLVIDKKSQSFDFSAADAVFRAAERARRLILPVLSPQDGRCDDQVFKQRLWYVDGWRRLSPGTGQLVSYADWVSIAVARYRSSPVVAGWELIGEPEPSVCLDLECTQRSCPADAATLMRRFADDAGVLVRSADPRRLIFAGFLGGNQCGTSAGDYVTVGRSRYVDVLSYHDYFDSGTVLPGDASSGLAARLRQARQLSKPLLVAEIGAVAGSCRSLEDRRVALSKTMSGQRAAGTAGGLVWAYVPDPRLTECTYDIGPADPLFAEIHTQTKYPYRRR
ncbi:MAG: beta-mannosidase [Nocardiaceae bacterium]|nr:beta-mannosidase [Nocardiaceae bacterium]